MNRHYWTTQAQGFERQLAAGKQLPAYVYGLERRFGSQAASEKYLLAGRCSDRLTRLGQRLCLAFARIGEYVAAVPNHSIW